MTKLMHVFSITIPLWHCKTARMHYEFWLHGEIILHGKNKLPGLMSQPPENSHIPGSVFQEGTLLLMYRKLYSNNSTVITLWTSPCPVSKFNSLVLYNAENSCSDIAWPQLCTDVSMCVYTLKIRKLGDPQAHANLQSHIHIGQCQSDRQFLPPAAGQAYLDPAGYLSQNLRAALSFC